MRGGAGRSLRALLLAAVACGASGCLFFNADGGGLLTRDQLGDWAGMEAMPRRVADPIPEAARRLERARAQGEREDLARELTDRLCRSGESLPGWPSDLVPAGGFRMKTRWLDVLTPFLFPEPRAVESLYYRPHEDPGAAPLRLYASHYGPAPYLAYLVLSGKEQVDVYDVDGGERVAARSETLVLGGLLLWRSRRVFPAERDGRPGLLAIGDYRERDEAPRYEIKDGTSLLYGLLGWGRVNRKRYLQILWIPIPVGDVDLPPEETREPPRPSAEGGGDR